MTRMTRPAVLAVMAVAASIAPAQAAPLSLPVLPLDPVRPLVATSFCAIAGVDRNTFGVSVYFTRPVSVTLTEGDGAKVVRQYAAVDAAQAARDESEGVVLYLEPGVDFVVADPQQGDCEGKVERKSGHMGVQMRRLAGARAARFLSAQPANAIVREARTEGYDFYMDWPSEAGRIAKLNALFNDRARDHQKDLEKIAAEQGTDQAEVNIPPQVTLTAYESTRVVGSNKQFLSMLTNGYLFTGGAHGFPGSEALLWDRKHGVRAVRELFSDNMDAFQAPWCAALDKEREARSNGEWTSAPGKKYLDVWECPTFDELTIVPIGAAGQPFDRIRFIADPYVAGPYSDGKWEITLGITPEVLSLIRAEDRAAFRAYQGETAK